MFLQALGKYLDDKTELGELRRVVRLRRAACSHYARWMAAARAPVSRQARRFSSFRTETWAAQDMRKSDVFSFAAQHAEQPERQRFLERVDGSFSTTPFRRCRVPTKRVLARLR